MGSTFLKKIILLLEACVVLVLLSYIGISLYYQDGFSMNTWINGVYCTGKSVEQVNSELLLTESAPKIQIVGKNGHNLDIDLEEVEYVADYTTALNKYIQQQNPYLWVFNSTLEYSEVSALESKKLLPDIIINTDQLYEIWMQSDIVKEELETEKCIEIRVDDSGFYLYDGLQDRLDVELTFQLITDAIESQTTVIDLVELDCYVDEEYNSEDEQIQITLSRWNKIDCFQSSNIIYDMGTEQIILNASVLKNFVCLDDAGKIVFDEGNHFTVDETAIKNFIKELCEKYDTYGKKRAFQTTAGDVKYITGGIYGTQIDYDAELSYLKNTLEERADLISNSIPIIDFERENWEEEQEAQEAQELVHIPTYSVMPYVRGLDDIGDTYIEIDLSNQKMYYYQNGELLIATDVVTGNMLRRFGTPEGINYVYAKQKNRTLRGQGYAAFVKYWMPIKGNIGIHDASWRDEFGGEIYETSGSHGCINTPTDTMAELYDMVEIGTPVISYY